MEITVKKMETESEIRGKAFVHWKSWQETYPGIVDQGYLDSLTLAKCEEIAFRWPDDIVIAKDGERVVGFAGYGKYRDGELEDTGEVFALYVLKEYWGTGIGLRLMEEALSQLEEFPHTAVWVLKENGRAIRFYEKCGFRPDGREEMLTLGAPVRLIRMIRHG